MPGIFCCFGNNASNDAPTAHGSNGAKDVTHAALDNPTTFPVNVSTKPDVAKEALEFSGRPSNQPRVPSPTVSPNLPVASLLADGRAGELAQSVFQGIDLQRKINLLQGHWWTRVEGAVELIAKTYSAACVSVWILDDSSESFVALLSKGPMRQAVQPGHAVHLGSEYDANSPSSLTSLWETKASQAYNVAAHSSNSSAASLSDRAAFPADWKLLYNAHHFTDFLALPILASPLSGADKPSPTSIPSGSAGVLMGTLGGGTASGGGHTVTAAATNGSEDGSGSSGQQVVGAVTLYFSRPDRVSEQPPSIFNTALEQDLVMLALASVLFSSGPEPVRQICELVLAVHSALGSGELAAAVAMGLTARLQHLFAVCPASLLALVPPKQVSAIVFRDQTVMPEAAGGVMDTMAGYSSSQTLPLLHPALASVAGGGGASGAAAPYSGSHLHGGAGLRVQYRAAGIHVGNVDASAAASIERSPSLLGTGLRGDGNAAGGAGPTATAITTTNNNINNNNISNTMADGSAAGGAGSAASRQCMPNSRSMGVLAGHNPSGLFSCRLDRPPSRYKALVFPLSHTLLQVVLQQRHEKKTQGRAGQYGSGGGGLAAAGGARQTSALRDLCMAAAAAAAAVSPSGATRGGWIVGDCNEHLHAVHSPSRDIYVMARVNGRRPHSLMLATAELWMPGGQGEGGAADSGGGNSSNSSATHIALYLAFQERLPRTLLELVLADVQLIMRQLLAPLIRHRFETNLAEEWTALAGAANNQPSPGGPVLRITSSMSASQARHVPPHGLLLSSMTPSLLGETSAGAAGSVSTTPPIAEAHSNTWLTRTGGAGTSAQLMLPGLGGNGATPFASPNELDLEGLSAGEALQQMSVLVSSYMDTLQALQGQLMASERVTETLRREDLPHLQLLEVLGHGGGGVVFRGKLHALEVAVKVFEVPGDLATAAGLPQHSTAVGAGAPSAGGATGNGAAASTGNDGKQAAWPAVGDRRVLQRSALELAVTASLSHPHIIQVYSLYTNMVLVKQKPPKQGTSGVQLMELSAVTALSRTDEGIPCSALCMEYCDMGTLAHAIDQHRFMTVTPLGTRRPALKAICTTLLEVALALRHLHARNLAHCDLKPANVLLKSSRRDSRGFTCKLADFGYVSVLKAAVPGGRPTILPEEACGTVTHMAPETFIKGQPLDFSVDTFSFGILMWELYVCARPYSDVAEDQIAQRVTLKGLRPTFPSDTPRSYGALARQCWSQDPNERPSASEIVAAIENMLQIMNTQLPTIPPHKPKPPAAAVVPAPQTGRTSFDRGHVEVVLEKPMPAMPRTRGSMNGGMVQLGPPQTQSPLGRVPVSPPVPPPDYGKGPGTGPGASQPDEEAS
ncbi:hypothetical protein Vafri_17603 [Volvox africanus]|uniref:Protein kinase domain-containing protein n=1 Tax=Volvox africanus TaxID=51714 RepID=A0A8J4BMC3_9CHLO|nr:hypothetical protein Vafri_17603 [Volvox africanus]